MFTSQLIPIIQYTFRSPETTIIGYPHKASGRDRSRSPVVKDRRGHGRSRSPAVKDQRGGHGGNRVLEFG